MSNSFINISTGDNELEGNIKFIGQLKSRVQNLGYFFGSGAEYGVNSEKIRGAERSNRAISQKINGVERSDELERFWSDFFLFDFFEILLKMTKFLILD